MPKKSTSFYAQLSTINFFSYLCTVFCRIMRQLVLVIALVAAAVLLLAVGVILRKDHSFRSQHIAENSRMKENKIHCATSQDREARRDNNRKINVKNL